jgi:pyruvate dehydrogenase E1 component alpha subunit
MKIDLGPDDLLAFEEDIAQAFGRGEIRSPVHLTGGNERDLIDIFRTIANDDWVLCSWRSHFHCLLKGVPPAELKEAIVGGRSIALCFPRQKILCSAIVGGIAPIAVGIASSLKRKQDEDPSGNGTFVHVFIGDMTAESGIVHESMKYASRHGLPIKWVIEDNGFKVLQQIEEGRGAFFACDVSKEEQVKSLVDTVTNVAGQVDIFCSNAGIMIEGGVDVLLIENGDLLEIDQVMARVAGKVPAGRILIDGTRVGEVGERAIKP